MYIKLIVVLKLEIKRREGSLKHLAREGFNPKGGHTCANVGCLS